MHCTWTLFTCTWVIVYAFVFIKGSSLKLVCSFVVKYRLADLGSLNTLAATYQWLGKHQQNPLHRKAPFAISALQWLFCSAASQSLTFTFVLNCPDKHATYTRLYTISSMLKHQTVSVVFSPQRTSAVLNGTNRFSTSWPLLAPVEKPQSGISERTTWLSKSAITATGFVEYFDSLYRKPSNVM